MIVTSRQEVALALFLFARQKASPSSVPWRARGHVRTMLGQIFGAKIAVSLCGALAACGIRRAGKRQLTPVTLGQNEFGRFLVACNFPAGRIEC